MLITFFRTIFLFLLITLILRIMGKRQIGELQPYELVVTLLLSELAVIPMASSDLPLLSGIIPMLILLLSQLTLSWWALKSNRARRFLSGKPEVLIERGQIMEDALLTTRLNISDLMELLRIKGYPDPSKVQFAILETCGQLSVIPKVSENPVTLKDIGWPLPQESAPPIPLILDGRLLSLHLPEAGLTEETFLTMLAKKGFHKTADIFFCAMDENQGLIIQARNSALQVPGLFAGSSSNAKAGAPGTAQDQDSTTGAGRGGKP